jgi:hypothetical protein
MFLFSVEKFIHYRGDIFRSVWSPRAAIDHRSSGFALRIDLEIDRDNIEWKTIRPPTPFIHIDLDQIDAIEGFYDQFVFVRQTGGYHTAGWSPRSIEIDDRLLSQRRGFLRFGRQLRRQATALFM